MQQYSCRYLQPIYETWLSTGDQYGGQDDAHDHPQGDVVFHPRADHGYPIEVEEDRSADAHKRHHQKNLHMGSPETRKGDLAGGKGGKSGTGKAIPN